MKVTQEKSKQNGVRLNVFLARCGVASRRHADELIKEGKVKVNGNVITYCGLRVNSQDRVEVGGKLVLPKEFVYFAFYKPRGVTTTMADRFAKRNVGDYIPSHLKGIFPVGRLDRDSEGLLILTNDGEFALRLTHPRFGVEKEYVLEVEGSCTSQDLHRACLGVEDKGEVLRIKKGRVERIGKLSRVRVVVKEGKKRHLRRIFKQLGLKVVSLKRVRIGNISLGNLEPGTMRSIPERKIQRLRFQE